VPAIPPSATTEPPRLPPLLVVPWADPVCDDLGVDPRGTYVERFWLPLLGPTSTWILRRFAVEFDASPDGFSLDTADAARSIGVGTRGGRTGPFLRAIDRCVRFGCAQHAEHGILAVRRRLPPLSSAQANRLPRHLRGAHEDWQRDRRRRGPRPADDAHATRLARSLLDVGATAAEVEDQLRRWGFDDTGARRALRAAVATEPRREAG
jgi:hypothetical protein